MSYRNPQQVVDTQSGQAFADLQKTISGTFAGVASAYKKEQDTEAARLKKIAEENKKAAQYYQRKEDEVTESLAKLNAKNPALNIGEEFTGIVDRYSDIMSMIQNGTITDPKEIAKLRSEAASILAIPDQVRTSIESFSASSIDLEKILKQKGKMGGYDLYSNPTLLKDLQIFLDQRPGERKININNDNGSYASSVDIVGEDGKTTNYPLSVLENFLSGGTNMINTVPDETTHLDNMSNTYVFDVNKNDKSRSVKDSVLGSVKYKTDVKGNIVTYKEVDKSKVKTKDFMADVASNIEAMNTQGRVAFYNNVLAKKNVRGEIIGEIATSENVVTDEFKNKYANAYADYFIDRQPKEKVISVKRPDPKKELEVYGFKEAKELASALDGDDRLIFDIQSIRDLASDYGLTANAEASVKDGPIERIVIGEYRGKKLAIDKNDTEQDIINKIIRVKSPELKDQQYDQIKKKLTGLKPGEGVIRSDTSKSFFDQFIEQQQ